MAQLSGFITVAVFILCSIASLAAPTNTNFSNNTKDNISKESAESSHENVPDTFMTPNDYFTVTAQDSQEHEYQPLSQFNSYHQTPSAQSQLDFHSPNSQNYYGSFLPETFSFDQIGPSFGQNFPYSPGIPNYAAPLPKVKSHPPPQQPIENHHSSLGPNFPYSPEIPSYLAPLPKANRKPLPQPHIENHHTALGPNFSYSPGIPSYLPKVSSYPPPQENLNTELLGSGNFGIIRGGTFYPDDELPLHSADGSDASDYFSDASNSHDEAHAAKVDFIDKYTYPEEQFEHFRDFAELSSPIDGAFSHFSSIHAKNNASKLYQNSHPKNIFEKLEQIDREKNLAKKKSRQTSKTKSKLSRTKLQKKIKIKSVPKDADYDPLLALS